MEIKLNGKVFHTHEARANLLQAFKDACWQKTDDISGLTKDGIKNVEKLIKEYLKSNDPETLAIAEKYRDLIKQLKISEKKIRSTKEYIENKKREKVFLKTLKLETKPEFGIYEFLECIFDPKTAKLRREFENSFEMKTYYEEQRKLYNNEITKKNIVISSLALQDVSWNPLIGESYIVIEEEILFEKNPFFLYYPSQSSSS